MKLRHPLSASVHAPACPGPRPWICRWPSTTRRCTAFTTPRCNPIAPAALERGEPLFDDSTLLTMSARWRSCRDRSG